MIFLETITNNRNALAKLNFGQWTDTYGNKFFSSKGSYQKIRIDKSFDEEYNNDTLFNLAYTSDTGSAWSMPRDAVSVVNNKNYNIIIRKYNGRGNTSSKHMVYIILDRSIYIKRNPNERFDKNKKFDNIKINIISYQPYFPISHTFSTRDGKYVGCIMFIDDEDLNTRELQPIMDIDMYNTSTRKYSTASITYNSLSQMMSTEVEEPNSVKLYELKSIGRSYNNEHQSFSVSSTKGDPTTAAFIAAPNYIGVSDALCSQIKNASIEIYQPDHTTPESLKRDIEEDFIKKGYKVVTLIGMSPYSDIMEVIEESPFLYIFNYYPEDKSITCVKSM